MFFLAVSGSGASISVSRLHDAGISWLDDGAEVQPRELTIVTLSCEDCISQLRAAASGSKPIGLLFFDYHSSDERRLSQILLAAGMIGEDGRTQRDGFRNALRLYLESPGSFVASPDALDALTTSRGGDDEAMNRARAQALNKLDYQQALMGLLGIQQTPTTIPVRTNSLGLPPDSSRDRAISSMRARRIGLQFLQPDRGTTQGSGVAEIFLAADERLDPQTWGQVHEMIKSGGAWIWVPNNACRPETRFAMWHRRLLMLPTDSARRAAFLEVTRALSEAIDPARLAFADGVSGSSAADAGTLTPNTQEDWLNLLTVMDTAVQLSNR